MDTFHGKPIDTAKLKQPVLENLRSNVSKLLDLIRYLQERETSLNQDVCYICAGTTRKPFAAIHGFNYVQCSGCGHVFTSKRYSQEALERFYQQNAFYSETTYANKETCLYRRENVARPKVEFAERYAKRSSGRWLDVGSGIGDLVSVARERGWTSTGLELSEHSVRFARETFNVELETITFGEFETRQQATLGTWDVVSLIGIIEHVTDPLDFLRRSFRLLAPGGIVMVQVPNAESFGAYLQTVYPDHVFRHMNPVDHIMVFTQSSLFKALEQTGFKVEATWYHGLDLYELVNTLVLTNPRVAGSRLHQTLSKLMNEFQLVVDQAELSNSLLCIARKP